ncbi:hypothetical protein HRI_002118600 [Hibiscus trionum]|uniref:Uncharacterized protein n=1 Tax=Hibiscus trionum TaxID=183268 RepID=A0A9W7HW20_HIBTR|nr:hypothetical protein HRI_002118600 [Hibiscus trionum]
MSIPPFSVPTTSLSSSQFTYQTTANPSYFPLPFHLQQQAQPYAPSPQPVPVAPVSGVYSLPQYQQAKQLFQRDAQIVTPEALESVKAALASSEIEHKAETKRKLIPRNAAGQSWEDPTLAEWPENDFRLFCDDLGNESSLSESNLNRFQTCATAPKEMNGKYVGNRPIKLRKSNWKERIDYEALERQKNQNHKKPKLLKKGILHK